MANTLGCEGGCACGHVRYSINREPLFVHCCHCSWCQRETGSAFVLNGLLEATEMTVLKGEVEIIDTPSASGRGQRISRCPVCRVALWSNYSAARDAVLFVRIGTLDVPGRFPPDIHIFTSTKLPWVQLGGAVPVVQEYYDWRDYWPEESVQRYRKAVS